MEGRMEECSALLEPSPNAQFTEAMATERLVLHHRLDSRSELPHMCHVPPRPYSLRQIRCGVAIRAVHSVGVTCPHIKWMGTGSEWDVFREAPLTRFVGLGTIRDGLFDENQTTTALLTNTIKPREP